ncbi:MAG: hypothetical protein EZS28_041646, partial [Streblomastix strix]
IDVRTDQMITGIKTFNKLLQVKPTVDGTVNQGIRICRQPNNQWSDIQIVWNKDNITGYIDNQWIIGTSGNDVQNPLGFVIINAGQETQANRGLMISADGNTLTFNGSVIA